MSHETLAEKKKRIFQAIDDAELPNNAYLRSLN